MKWIWNNINEYIWSRISYIIKKKKIQIVMVYFKCDALDFCSWFYNRIVTIIQYLWVT